MDTSNDMFLMISLNTANEIIFISAVAVIPLVVSQLPQACSACEMPMQPARAARLAS